jgi:glycosyltransferase involved in cell wall biosynthesis
MKRILIEGWRGINHSYAMVNQYQLAELVKLDGFVIQHRDIPFANAGWNATQNNPGFPESFMKVIEAIPAATDEGPYDCAYRISWPYARSFGKAEKTITFMTAEYGVTPQSFPGIASPAETFCSGQDMIVVPSNWSRSRLVEYGFPQDKVTVVPHGVNPEFFKPLPAVEHDYIRANMGFRPDEFVFLNVGAMSWNKGLDVLLKAFCWVRKKHPRARLVLKDDRQLYGIGVQEVVNDLLTDKSVPFDGEVLGSIKVLSATLTMEIMRNLYATADTYVSAYRAEGFNLPVIEAMACGTPVIVTEGGPTDDFCDPAMSSKITCTVVPNALRGIPAPGFHLEPSLDSLVDKMSVALSTSRNGDEQEAARTALLEKHSWAACSRKLAALF